MNVVIRFLPTSLVLAIHDDQIRLYGGRYGVRDAAALDAALHMPQAQFGGQFLHATIFHMAAAYGFHLSQDHPFIDGNKRTAGMSMLTFLSFNGFQVSASEMEYYEAMMAIANSQKSKDWLTQWLQTVTNGTPPEII